MLCIFCPFYLSSFLCGCKNSLQANHVDVDVDIDDVDVDVDDDMYAGGHLAHCCVTGRRLSE